MRDGIHKARIQKAGDVRSSLKAAHSQNPPSQGLGLYALDWRHLSGYHSLQLSISASSQQNFAGEELAHGRNYTALSVSAEPTLFLLAMWSEVSLASPTPAGALH